MLGCAILLSPVFEARSSPLTNVQTVFVIVMENHNWDTIHGNPDCPYINNTLLPMASRAERYFTPTNLHPSEPNYLWLEAGTNFGILDDQLPAINHIDSTNHLVTLLEGAGISWKTYQESLNADDSPLTNNYPYATRHNPFVFFDDIATNGTRLADHVRPYSELAADLQSGAVARYNFIVPNVTNDMHSLAPGSPSAEKQGDDWLALEVPRILSSAAYTNDGALFIVWDEGDGDTSDGPIGLILLSPLAKGGGYANDIYYTHSSLLRTLQEIFGVGPLLGDAAKAVSLSDLFGLAAPIRTNTLTNIQTVFLILMENVNWPALKGSPSAPYLNNTLLPMASYCEQYYTPPGLPGSLPNYLWLEAGTNFGVLDSGDPSAHTFSSTNHLVTLLANANISWKSYQENISGTNCPVSSSGLYAAYHNPFVYFRDIITNTASCVAHIRPFPELAADLTNNTVARYNFITPNLCDDMHNSTGCATSDRIRNGDNWLADAVPRILAAPAYQNNGALFITWDEGVNPTLSGPIGMLVISPLARGGGYASTNRYTHASTLRTMQEIFGVRPFLADAAAALSLSDLFRDDLPDPPLRLMTANLRTNGRFQFTLAGLTPGKTNLVQASADFSNWVSLSTNAAASNTIDFVDSDAGSFGGRFFRCLELP